VHVGVQEVGMEVSSPVGFLVVGFSVVVVGLTTIGIS
jgi:hypothetical protein